MRLLIRLRCAEDGPYEMQYHYHLQGFIYRLLKGSKYDYLHDKGGYKFFCFSNIFPAQTLKKGDLRTLMISSPDEGFIEHIHVALLHWNDDIRIGSMAFRITSIDKLEIKLTTPFTLITGTPILLRIPREKYQDYCVEPKGQYDSVYWRNDHPIELFVSQLENNLMKKYAEYFGFNTDHSLIENEEEQQRLHTGISKFKFKKQISTRVPMKGFDQIVIGTMWEFEFDSDANVDMVKFALDSGLGERNSLGFGFMNVVVSDKYS